MISPVEGFIIKDCAVCGRLMMITRAQSKRKLCSGCMVLREQARRQVVRASMKKSARGIINGLKKRGCCVCGYSKCMWAIEFHHINQDKGTVVSKIRTVPALIKEFKEHPLVVLCSNCHRELHHGDINEKELYNKTIEV